MLLARGTRRLLNRPDRMSRAYSTQRNKEGRGKPQLVFRLEW